MLFKYIKEVEMPNLNHCIECDKPGALTDGLCNNCYSKHESNYDSVTKAINNNVDELTNFIKSTPEYNLGKKILEGDIDGDITTADKHNKEWLDEK